jgi:hypothetical protein
MFVSHKTSGIVQDLILKMTRACGGLPDYMENKFTEMFPNEEGNIPCRLAY